MGNGTNYRHAVPSSQAIGRPSGTSPHGVKPGVKFEPPAQDQPSIMSMGPVMEVRVSKDMGP